MIKVYPSQITKVIEGLLSNALKYSPTNGEVTIHIDQDEHNTTLTVNNQGDGIDDNLADRLFEINSSDIRLYCQAVRRDWHQPGNDQRNNFSLQGSDMDRQGAGQQVLRSAFSLPRG